MLCVTYLIGFVIGWFMGGALGGVAWGSVVSVLSLALLPVTFRSGAGIGGVIGGVLLGYLGVIVGGTIGGFIVAHIGWRVGASIGQALQFRMHLHQMRQRWFGNGVERGAPSDDEC